MTSGSSGRMTGEESPDDSELHWWQTGVVYQIYPRSFKDTTGNGVGDLEGIIDGMDYLGGDDKESLGIDAIWMSPFYPSPMADFGYDVSDYCDVNPLFGDLATFDRLIEAAHERGLKVIIDYVPNHSSDRHPWFQQSRTHRDDPRREWYIWRDAQPDGSPPNNWGSAFGGSAWTRDEPTGQYYLHQFLSQQPELNWRNPQLANAMMDVLRFWLDRGVDGFRMDVVGMISKDALLRDNPPRPGTDHLPENDLYGRQLHIHNEDQDDVHEIVRRFRKLLDSYDDRCAIGELGYSLSRWLRYYGTDGDGLHLPFNFRLMEQPWDAGAIRKSVERLEAALPPWAWPNYVLGSHDVHRLASRIGTAPARVAAMLLLTLRGTPTLYQGDELGLEDGVISPDRFQDPRGLRLGAEQSRDPGRTPLQWNPTSHAGFSTTEPWLPISADYEVRNVAAQREDPRSILNLYRKLLRLRRATPALHRGSYTTVESGHDDCFVYQRSSAEGVCLVALNFGSAERRLSIPDHRAAEIVLSTHLDRCESTDRNGFTLRPNEGTIIEVKP